MNDVIIKLYNEGKSPYEISEILSKNGLKCYPNKVRRTLTKNGIQIRSKGEAQKQALESGRSINPTKGKKISPEVKKAMGEAISKTYTNTSEEEKERRAKISRTNWKNMSEEFRTALRKKSADGVRKAAEFGSKMEKFLLTKLSQDGLDIHFHSRIALPNARLQIDLLIPSINTAIEIDGISHYEPIWGEEAFKKVKAADELKNGLLLRNGYNVIRIKTMANTFSNVYSDKIYNKLVQEIEIIKKNRLRPIEERLVFIDG